MLGESGICIDFEGATTTGLHIRVNVGRYSHMVFLVFKKEAETILKYVKISGFSKLHQQGVYINLDHLRPFLPDFIREMFQFTRNYNLVHTVIPLGCTYPGCFDKFGSHLDWERHEGSQHFHKECWGCGCNRKIAPVNGKAGPACAELFHREELFKTHLRVNHHLPEDKTQERCNRQRIRQSCSGSFWCGFCVPDRATGGKG